MFCFVIFLLSAVGSDSFRCFHFFGLLLGQSRQDDLWRGFLLVLSFCIVLGDRWDFLGLEIISLFFSMILIIIDYLISLFLSILNLKILFTLFL